MTIHTKRLNETIPINCHKIDSYEIKSNIFTKCKWDTFCIFVSKYSIMLKLYYRCSLKPTGNNAWNNGTHGGAINWILFQSTLPAFFLAIGFQYYDNQLTVYLWCFAHFDYKLRVDKISEMALVLPRPKMPFLTLYCKP